VRRIFPRTSQNLTEKFYAILPTNVLLQISWRPFFGVTSKGVTFLQTSGVLFWIQTTLGAVYSRIFRDFYQIFSKSNISACACTPCTLTSNTTAFHSSIIDNFLAYKDWLETNLLQLFGHPEYSEWFSKILLLFLRSALLMNRNKHFW